MSNLQHPARTRKPGASPDPSPLAAPHATVSVPEPILIDYLIDHLLVEHLLIERPVDLQPDRILELMADHLADLPLEREIAIPVEESLDHLLDHLFKIEMAMEDDEDDEDWEVTS